MKRIIFLALFLILGAELAYGQIKYDITSPFKLWLLNNEARAMSSMNSDITLLNKLTSPFSILPGSEIKNARAEEKLWNTHRKIYSVLDEIQQIYSAARKYGNGRFSILFKQSRPEIWAVIPLQISRPGLVSLLAVEYRKAFHSTLLQTLELDTERDLDLPARLGRTVKKLSDEEARLLEDYFSSFSALFTTDSSVKLLRSFIESGAKKNFAPGMKDLLKPVFTAPVFAELTVSQAAASSEDPLAELEKLAAFEESSGTTTAENENTDTAGSNETSATTLEPPDPGTEDLFKIWD